MNTELKGKKVKYVELQIDLESLSVELNGYFYNCFFKQLVKIMY